MSTRNYLKSFLNLRCYKNSLGLFVRAFFVYCSEIFTKISVYFFSINIL